MYRLNTHSSGEVYDFLQVAGFIAITYVSFSFSFVTNDGLFASRCLFPLFSSLIASFPTSFVKVKTEVTCGLGVMIMKIG